MNMTFEEKRGKLLRNLKDLALRHNRDYYFSIIPIVESATAEQEDMLDMYALALDVDGSRLAQSRGALTTIQKVNFLI